MDRDPAQPLGARRVAAASRLTPAEIAAQVELADFAKMEQIRYARRRDRAATRRTADALKPWYRQFCKRPCFHDDYLADVQPAERHARRHRTAGASSASPSAVSWSPAWSTSSTA